MLNVSAVTEEKLKPWNLLTGIEPKRTKLKQAVREAATICPRPGLQRKRAAAALSQAGRAGPDQPIRASPARRPHTPPADRMYATDVVRQKDVRQQHRLMPPGRGIIIWNPTQTKPKFSVLAKNLNQAQPLQWVEPEQSGTAGVRFFPISSYNLRFHFDSTAVRLLAWGYCVAIRLPLSRWPIYLSRPKCSSSQQVGLRS